MNRPTLEAIERSARPGPRGSARVDRDAALVERLRRQDPGAAEGLVATYGDRVYRLAIRITGNEQDAEEVVQDALWTAARKIDSFKGESAFGSWLYRITANAAYQKLRGRQGKRHEVSWDDLLPTFDEQGHHVEPVGDWSAQGGGAGAPKRAAHGADRRRSTTCPGTTGRPSCCTTSRGCPIRRSPRRCTSACPP